MAGQVHPSAPDAALLHNNKMSSHQGSPVLPPPATYAKPRGHRRHRGGLAGCCCCLLSTFCSLLFAFLFLAGLTILILWLVLKPVHLPKYSLDNVEVKQFLLNESTRTLNADFAYNFTANNPNRKIGIKYDTINLETKYSGQSLGKSVIPGFYQGHRNVTSLSSELKVVNVILTPASTNALNTQITANNVPMHVRANAKVHVRIGKYTSPGFKVRVDCDVNMGVNPATVISKSCKLKRSS